MFSRRGNVALTGNIPFDFQLLHIFQQWKMFEYWKIAISELAHAIEPKTQARGAMA